MNQETIQQHVINSDNVREWMDAELVKRQILTGKNTVAAERQWKAPDDDYDVTPFLLENFTQHNAIAPNFYYVQTSWGHGTIQVSISQIQINMIGEEDQLCELLTLIESRFATEEFTSFVTWVYNQDGRTKQIHLPMERKPIVESAYPFLPMPVMDYIDDYVNSDSCILILSGPPGTGKTSLIRELLYRSRGNSFLTYDNSVLQNDSFFADFIAAHEKFLILEDSDLFIGARAEGNNLMHRFLNLSDGLVSTKHKKIIFTTNLPNVTDIDPALLRPGRCYDVVQFRELKGSEINGVCEELNISTPDRTEMPLSEIFTTQPGPAYKKRSIGFGFNS
jgi:ATPase family associated with various cellular activities (AAA)